MHHCPYCGTKVLDNEIYCVECGEKLPGDMQERQKKKKSFNNYWYIPMSVLLLLVLASGLYYIFMQHQSTKAAKLYQKAETYAMEGNYTKANDTLQKSLNNAHNFQQAKDALHFTEKAKSIQKNMEQASDLLDKKKFQQALALINEAEDSLTNYNGEAVTKLIDKLTKNRNRLKLAQLKHKLNQDPNIDDLKVLLWEADEIQSDEADKIMTSIRNQIVDYTFSKASEQLNDHQFSDALLIVEDGLKYAPDSKKLHSLKTTIDKEKTAFETAQRQRMEQAINSAEQERKLNENDAIELVTVQAKRDKQGKVTVQGKVKSAATIPVNSILVEYSLLTDDKTRVTNKVYVYPDTLYPDETGQFSFTHYEIDQKTDDLTINVDRIKWYTDQQQ
ncbi:zinc ribbon domain-containing protein [Lentibacillus cibarius]|uniref:Zinc ribbon domain-containing protein n=1 Tax=Lentibacillus cibarius TaxID=2583219 RepID=A0A5S3QND3_9BACI|nr:zinc ribbon domain-containing protein [Lentibacillus cibarius]TMN23420.1 zinc ribbon domain-containing protein [Lentibacillus cibarius]